MTLEDCRGRCSMDYSIPIDEVTKIFKLNQWKWQHLTKNAPMSRSSKWNSALRGKMLEGATENNKDGERKKLLSLQNQNTTDILQFSRYYSHEDGVCKDFLYKGERGNRNRFLTRQTCESSCFEAQDVCELPKVWILDKLVFILTRWSVLAMATWNNSGMIKRKTTASPSITEDAKGMETNLTH